MLTITGLIRRPAPTPKVAPEPTPPRKVTKYESLKARRVVAAEAGRCTICVTAHPPPGFKTCDTCRARAKKYERRNTR